MSLWFPFRMKKRETDNRKCINTARLIINKMDCFWQIGIKSMHERISYARHQLTNRKIRPFALPTKLLKWWKISIIQLTNVSIGNDVGLVAFQTITRSERNVHCTSFSNRMQKMDTMCVWRARVCMRQQICLYGIMFWLNRNVC